MKLLSCFIFFALSFSLWSERNSDLSTIQNTNDLSDSRIWEVLMDERIAIPVPTHPKVTTTVSFPQVIGSPDGAGFTVSPSQVKGEFLISWSPGNTYFSITPLSQTSRRNLNVPFDGKIYSFEFFPSSEFQAALQIIMRDSPKLGKNIKIKRKTTPPKPQFQPASSPRIVGVLDTLKMLLQLDDNRLAATLEKMPYIEYVVNRDITSTDYGSYNLSLIASVRNNKFDTIAFAVRIENTSNEKLQIDPESWSARVGDRVFYQVTSDSISELDAKNETIIYFAIIGTPEGSPNFISADNPWIISVDNFNSKNQISKNIPIIPFGMNDTNISTSTNTTVIEVPEDH